VVERVGRGFYAISADGLNSIGALMKDLSSVYQYHTEQKEEGGLTVPVDTGSMIVRSGFAGRNLVLSINRFKSGSA